MDYCYVNSKIGRIKGIQTQDSRHFNSIPYLKTPRFTEGTLYGNLGEFDGTQESVNCHQRLEYMDEAHEENNFYYREFDYLTHTSYNEDYQTLTIIAPKDGENHPVIIFFHGGSFENGCICDEPFGSSEEYAKRGMVLVIVGYRLNVFGLYDSQNYLLKDMLNSILWVKENIQDFSGDPDNITLMGQSAGALSISLLLKDKEDVQPLIKGAILISGIHVIPDMVGPRNKKENRPFWQEVRKAAGAENLEELKNVDSRTLWESWHKIKKEKGNFHTSMPAVDGKVVKDRPYKIAERNQDCDVPIMMGVTSQDMFPFMIFESLFKDAKQHSRHKKQPVYCYFFDRCLPGNYFKAFHAADLWYFFGNMKLSWRPFGEYDYQLSAMMIDYVCNFAANHDPNSDKLPKWESFTCTNKFLRYFGDDMNQKTIRPFACRQKMFHTTFIEKGPF